MLMYQKSMFDPYYCMGDVLTSNNVENVSKRLFFACVQNGVDARVTMRHFDNAAFRAYAHVTVTSRNNVCYSVRLT